MTPRGRRRRRIAAGMLVTVIALGALAPLALHLIIRRQLQSVVAEKLDADLAIGSIEYVYPFGLVLNEAVITAHNRNGRGLKTITIPRLAVALAHSPLSNGPIVVDKLAISDPQLHVILVGSPQSGQSPEATEAASPLPANLSSLFQIRELAIRGGQVVWDDQRLAGTEPMVLNQLNVNLRNNSDSPAQYTYEIACDDGRRANLRCTGSVDVDDLLLKIANCSLSLGIEPHGPDSTLPANVQAMLRPWQAHGVVQIDLAATLPLSHPLDGVCNATMKLHNAGGVLPELQLPLNSAAISLDFSDVSDQTAAHPRVKIESLDASVGGMRLWLSDTVATADLGSKTWQLNVKHGRVDAGLSPTLPGTLLAALEKLRLSGAVDFTLDASGPLTVQALAECTGQLSLRPDDLTVQPDGFDLPLGGFTDATVALANGDLRFESLGATYADNLLFIKDARVRAVGLPDHFRADNIAGCLTLGPDCVYPGPLVRFLRDTHPIGPFLFEGDISVEPDRSRPPVDYHFNVHTTSGRLTLGSSRIPLRAIDTVVSITPASAIMSKFNASLLDGRMTGTAEMHFTPGFPYEFHADCRDIDLKRLADDLASPGEKPIRLSGRGVLSSHLRGTIPSDGSPAWHTFAGEGEFEIRRGDFWEIPIMKSIAGAFAKDALTVGEAAGRFHIGGGKVHFDHAIASSPLLGVEGAGDVTYAGALDFTGTADPFGSWGERVGGGPLSVIAGALQRTVNIATSQVLYQIRVTGTTSQPKTTQVLAPLVTHGVQGLLMLTHDPNRANDLFSEMHKQSDAREPSHP